MSVERSPEGVETIAERSARPLEVAHVLFMDVVSYSVLPMDRQRSVIEELQNLVRRLPEFVDAQATNQLICLPTGDGMALVFFGDPTVPFRCAQRIASATKNNSRFRLRMGLHTGPVYRLADINANLNIAGGGINYAQRVMDCGDSGHILLSAAVADMLLQLTDFEGAIHDVGEARLKHGAVIRIFNAFTKDFGNPERPSKLRGASPAAQPERLSVLHLMVATVAGGVVVTFAGFVTSMAYNSAFGRTAGFEGESPLSWPIWGARALFAPVGFMALVAVAVMLLRVAARLALTVGPLEAMCKPLLGAIHRVHRRLETTQTVTLASVLLLVQVATMAFMLWRFWDLVQGIDAIIGQGRSTGLEVFRPSNGEERSLFFYLLFPQLLVFGLGWLRMFQRGRARAERDATPLVTAGIVAWSLTLFFGQIVPWRIVFQSRGELVEYRSRACYLLGQRDGDALLFCPVQPPPWTQIVKLDDVALKREGVIESVFAAFDRNR